MDTTLSLKRIESRAQFVVYAPTPGLISEHQTRGDALKALANYLTEKGTSDAGIYERGEQWRPLL